MTKIQKKYKLFKRYQEDIWGELYFRRKKSNITKLVYSAASAYLTRLNPKYLDITRSLPFRKKKLYKNIKGKSDVMLKRFFLYFLNLNIKRIPSILKKIKRSKISWSQSFALWFESRLDSFLYRLNLFFSKLQLKNWILSKKILVNYKPVYSFNYNLSIGDRISFSKKNKEILINQFKYNYLNWYNKKYRWYNKKSLKKKNLYLEGINLDLKKKYIYFFFKNLKKRNIYFIKKVNKKQNKLNRYFNIGLNINPILKKNLKISVLKKKNVSSFYKNSIYKKKNFLKISLNIRKKKTKFLKNFLRLYNSKKVISLYKKSGSLEFLNLKKKNIFLLRNNSNNSLRKKHKKYLFIYKYWKKRRNKNLSSIPFFFPPYIELDYKLFLFTFWRAPFWHEIPFFTKFDTALIAGNNLFK